MLTIPCRDQSGAPFILSDYFVTLRWRYDPDGPMTYSAVMTKSNQTTNPGECWYRWLPHELIAPQMVYDAVITEEAPPNRFVTQLDEVTLFIRPKAEDPGASSSPSQSPSGSPTSSVSASPSHSVSSSTSSSVSKSPSSSASSSVSSSRSSSTSSSVSSSVSKSPSASPSSSPSAS